MGFIEAQALEWVWAQVLCAQRGAIEAQAFEERGPALLKSLCPLEDFVPRPYRVQGGGTKGGRWGSPPLKMLYEGVGFNPMPRQVWRLFGALSTLRPLIPATWMIR